MTAKQENQLRVVTMPCGILLLCTHGEEFRLAIRTGFAQFDIPAVSFLSRPTSAPEAGSKPGRVLIRSLAKGAWRVFG
ncbi:MAG: hypothetical protein R3268_02735 [Acidiferrobacterales bacterium]|nr:hypothetical protein [Acidiferrobacterales bacterium]